MSSSHRTLAFVMDPLDAIDVDADTTFALMLEAQRRSHEILYVAPSDLIASNHGPSTLARPVELRREQGRHFDLGEARTVSLDDEVDLVFQRVDPPVDAEYVISTQILALCRRAVVLNRPEGILVANEKLYTLQFSEFMAETLVSRRIPELLGFMDELGGEMIVKPLDGKGGEGIFHLRREDQNLRSILEQSAITPSSPHVMAEIAISINNQNACTMRRTPNRCDSDSLSRAKKGGAQRPLFLPFVEDQTIRCPGSPGSTTAGRGYRERRSRCRPS